MLIRELTALDAGAYYSVRLEALETASVAFASDAAEFRTRSLERVAADLTPLPGKRFTLGAFEGETLIGIATFFREERVKLAHKGWVVGVFVRAIARERGVGRALLTELIARARRVEGVEQLHLAVGVPQVPARALYQALGFRTWGVEPVALRVDGEAVDEEHMVLRFVEKG